MQRNFDWGGSKLATKPGDWCQAHVTCLKSAIRLVADSYITASCIGNLYIDMLHRSCCSRWNIGFYTHSPSWAIQNRFSSQLSFFVADEILDPWMLPPASGTPHKQHTMATTMKRDPSATSPRCQLAVRNWRPDATTSRQVSRRSTRTATASWGACRPPAGL